MSRRLPMRPVGDCVSTFVLVITCVNSGERTLGMSDTALTTASDLLLLISEDVRKRYLQPLHQFMESGQSDALLTILQAEDR